MLKFKPFFREPAGSTHRKQPGRVFLAFLKYLLSAVNSVALTSYFQAQLTGVFLYTRGRLRTLRVTSLVGLVACLALLGVGYGLVFHPASASAGPANTINFQARLETASGAIAADGTYNVEFKLYSASSGGSALWTEDYLVNASQGIRTANGYLTANLGSITAFPNTINWGQQLYLTMNIGGTGTTASYDGEMSPRLSLTSVPSAFAINSYNSVTGFTGSLTVAQATGGNQTFTVPDQGSAGSYTLLTTNTANANFIQNQNASAQTTANFWISATGRAGTSFLSPLFDVPTAGVLQLGTGTATSVNIGKVGVTTTVGGALAVTGAATLSSTLTVAGTVGINTLTPSATLEVAGIATAQTGTGTISSAGTTVTGSGTSFTTQLHVGDTITASGQSRTVMNIASNTSLTSSSNFSPVLSGASFTYTQPATRLTSGGANQQALFVQGAASSTAATFTLKLGAGQTGDLFDVVDDTGAVMNKTAAGGGFFSNGNLGVGQLSAFTNSTGGNARLSITLGNAASSSIVAKANASQTANLIELQSSGGTLLSGFNANGQLIYQNSSNTGTLAVATLGGNRTYTLPDESGTICTNASGGTCSTLYIQNQNSSAQTSSTFWVSGTGAASSLLVTTSGGLDTTTAGTLNIGLPSGGNATSITLNQSTIANGKQFTNNGSTLLTATTLSNFGSTANIGTAAATVDMFTTFKIPQTTAGVTLSLPAPTSGTAGRLVYVINTGSAAFTMHTVSIQAGKAQTYVYDGSNWTATNIDGAGSGSTFVGTLDSITPKVADGATITGNGLYLQTADANFAGLVSTGIQTFAGAKTLTGLLTGQAGLSISGGAVNLQANAASQLTTSAGGLTFDAATSVQIGGSTATGVTIGHAGIATTIQGNTIVTLNATTGTGMVCQNISNQLSACDANFLTPTASNFIRNQTGSTQSGDFKINGTGTLANLYASGNLGINNATAANIFAINTLTTAQSGYQATISTNGTTNNGLVIQGVASQGANTTLLNLETSTGSSLFSVIAGGTARLASSSASIVVGTSSGSATGGSYVKTYTAGTGGVTANDIVVLANDSGTARVIDSTTAYDSRVLGVAATTATAGNGVDVTIGGTTTVNYTGTAPAIGDQLVVSGTSGSAVVDNNATQGVLGYATTAGSSGTVGVRIQITNLATNATIRGNLTVQGVGTSGFSGTVSAAALQNAGASFSVNSSGNVVTVLSGTTGGTLVCQNASNQLSTCTNTYETSTGTDFVQSNPGSQQTANFNIIAASTKINTIQGASGVDILDLKSNGGSLVASITSTGGATFSGTVTNTQSTATNTSGEVINVTNTNNTVTSNTVNGQSINLSGSTNNNSTSTNNAINFSAVTPATGNNFYGLNFGTGYNDILRYNGTQLISGTGILQSAALSGTYSGQLTLSNVNNAYTGANLTIAATSGTAAIVTGASGQDILQLNVNGGSSGNALRVDSAGNLVSQHNGQFTNSNATNNGYGISSAYTNTNASASTTTTSAYKVTLTGTSNSNGAGTNVLNGVNLTNVTPVTGNQFNGIYAGTGYDNILNYNGTSIINGTGILQNAALSSATNYSNLQNVSALTASGNVNFQGTTQVALSGTTGATLVCRNASNILATCTSTYETNTGTDFIQNNPGSQQTANFNILANATKVTTIQGASGVDILDLKANGGGTVASIDQNGKLTAVGVAAGTGQITGSGGTNISGAIGLNGITTLTVSTAVPATALVQSVTNTSGSGSAAVNAQSIGLTGATTTGANTNVGINLLTVTPLTNNNFVALKVGTGFNDILNYNNTQLISGAGLFQNAGFDSSINYSSLQKVTTLTASSNVDFQGTTKVVLSGTTGATLVCQNATGLLSTCTNTYEASTGTDFIQNNPGAQQTANFNILANASKISTVQGASGMDIFDFKTNGGTVIASLDQNGKINGGAGAAITGAISGTYTNTTGEGLLLTVNNSGVASAHTVNAQTITLSGQATTGLNTNSALSLTTVTPASNNLFYGLNFGTGYNDILRYNSTQLISGTGLIQNATFDSSLNYSNLQKVTTLTASGNVDLQGTTKVALSGTTGATLVCQNVSGLLAGCTNTYETTTGTDFIQNNPAGQQTANFNILANATKISTIQGASGVDILDLKANGGGTVVTIDSVGKITGVGLAAGAGQITGTGGTNISGAIGLNGITTLTVSTAVPATALVQNLTNTSGSGSTAVNAQSIALTGGATSGTNTNVGLNLTNVTALANNTFTALKVGTGFNDILNYNNTQLISGTGLIQNATFDSTINYSNLQKVTTLTASGNVDLQGTTKVALSGTTGATLVCQNATSLLSTCTNTYETSTGTDFIQNNPGSQQTANFNILANATKISTIQGASGVDIFDLKANGGGTVVAIDSVGKITQTVSNSSTGNALAQNVTNTSNSGSATLSAHSIALTGGATSGTNTNVGFNLTNVTALANNTFTALKVGTGFNDILNYNGTQLISGTGLIQNAGFDSTLNYSNLQKVTTLTASGNVDLQGTTKVALSGTTGTTMVCQNATSLLSSCDATYLAPTATNFIQNQTGTPQTGGYNVTGNGLIGGTLTVTGLATLNGGITVTGGTANINASGANAVNIGSASAGAVGILSGGAITITAVAASTFSTTTGQLTIGSGSGTLGVTSGTTTLQRTAASDFTIDLNDSGTRTLILNNSGTGVGNLNLNDGSLQTAGTTRIDNSGNFFSNTETVSPTADAANVFQVQNAVDASVVAVDTGATNYAQNSGADTSGTFGTYWTQYGTATITRDTTNFISGVAAAKAVTSAVTSGVKNTLSATLTNGQTYLASFSAKVGSASDTLSAAYLYNGAATDVGTSTCATAQTMSNTGFLKFNCYFTIGSTPTSSNAFAVYSASSGKTFYVDNLAITQQTTNTLTVNQVRIGGVSGQGLTVLSLDTAAAAPTGSGTNNTALLGSMYYDTTAQAIQCYGANGWGACGVSPNVGVNLIPEYSGAVLNGGLWGANNIGTMTSDICSYALAVNKTTGDSTCGTAGDDYNYYKWTSPQATSQTYSIFVRYQMPATFKTFASDSTVSLTGRTTNTSSNSGSGVANGVQYSMYYYNTNTNTLTQCGSTTTVTTGTNAWNATSLGGSGETTCTANSGVTGGIAGNSIVLFRIDVTSSSSSSAYVSNLSFLTLGK